MFKIIRDMVRIMFPNKPGIVRDADLSEAYEVAVYIRKYALKHKLPPKIEGHVYLLLFGFDPFIQKTKEGAIEVDTSPDTSRVSDEVRRDLYEDSFFKYPFF